MKTIAHSSRMLLWKVVAIAMVVVLSGCSSDLGPDQIREKELKSQSGEVVIGVVWPFAQRNDQFREGLQLALEEVNEKGVLGGKKIRLIEEDDEGSTTKGMAIAQQFAENTSVAAVIGHRSSSVTIPASRIYDHAGILLLSPASTSPKLTDVNSSYIFRNIPNDDQLGQALALYAAETDYRNIAIYYTDDEYGRGLANSFEDQAGKSNLRIVDRLSGYKEASDVRRIADKWEALDCELILVATSAADGIAFIKELRAAGVDTPIIGGDALDSAEFAAAGEDVQDAVVASVYNPLEQSKINEHFKQQFIAKYGVEPGKWAAQAYDSLKLLADAIEGAGSRSPAEISTHLTELKQWEGAAGSRSFSDSGDVQEMGIVMKQLRNGVFEYLAK
ncbi:Leucine-, isoleucine-, valine-, threonine-, and alanine-binding protein [Paenibacillus plantiphilus]|uniref:Leucine-, isoleucine-, valine-, threonine-, and alanine-binding protein n=1 Tax=Paenibacillus plantiphilus TaxID=2905650 RepID=A0ABN8FZH8_9BACL|nr:ABC transporter substrate-binding protein [Paenibacillus plantiphilus]CAH1195524.1 Leucine-, isoleucine-, valine-, threonine-, and alanine-binding protein [Paenibacillus plantiphilus]